MMWLSIPLSPLPHAVLSCTTFTMSLTTYKWRQVLSPMLMLHSQNLKGTVLKHEHKMAVVQGSAGDTSSEVKQAQAPHQTRTCWHCLIISSGVTLHRGAITSPLSCPPTNEFCSLDMPSDTSRWGYRKDGRRKKMVERKKRMRTKWASGEGMVHNSEVMLNLVTTRLHVIKYLEIRMSCIFFHHCSKEINIKC